MDVLSFRDYCLSLPLTEESTPFDETTLVYKIGGKMYACADMNDFGQVAVKCDPDEAVRLRERDEEIRKLEKQMQEASRMLEFEYAAVLRDRIIELRKEQK